MKNHAFLAFLSGALLAGAAALLLAPDSGVNTRRKIKGKMKHEHDRMKHAMKHKLDAVKEKYQAMTDKMKESVCDCEEA